jgi:hypothetical protein
VVKGLKEVLVFFSLESYIGEKIVWGSWNLWTCLPFTRICIKRKRKGQSLLKQVIFFQTSNTWGIQCKKCKTPLQISINRIVRWSKNKKYQTKCNSFNFNDDLTSNQYKAFLFKLKVNVKMVELERDFVKRQLKRETNKVTWCEKQHDLSWW